MNVHAIACDGEKRGEGACVPFNGYFLNISLGLLALHPLYRVVRNTEIQWQMVWIMLTM